MGAARLNISDDAPPPLDLQPAMNTRLSLFAAALWWGSLSTIGFLVVPMLFAHLSTSFIAGQMAAKLFAAQTWVSTACCLILLVVNRPGRPAATLKEPGSFFLIVLGLLFALLIEHGVAPRIVARENLRLWHSAGTAMYALQWLCAAIVLWRMAGRRPALP